MRRNALNRLLEIVADERNELLHHQGVLRQQQQSMQQRLAELDASVQQASLGLHPGDHDQYLAYCRSVALQKQEISRRLAVVKDADRTVVDALLKVHHRRRSYEHLIDKEKKEARRRANRQQRSMLQELAVRRWAEVAR